MSAPTLTRGGWAKAIRAAWQKSLGGIIECGKLLIEAKKELPRGFEAMIEADLPFGPRTARRLMAVAVDKRLTDRTHASVLPPSWMTLYQLTKLSDDDFEARVGDGTIHAGMERKDINKILFRESRDRRHTDIAAKALSVSGDLGRFPLIYADPPWKFEAYAKEGTMLTPERHYPTLTDAELASFKVVDTPLIDVAADDAALFMWCTSSNLHRALGLLEQWGFVFKSSAVWVKTTEDGVTPWRGTGLVFRNAHEVLLYGTRGKMPGPMYQPSSVFMYPRGAHSAKPPEIRQEIELMYPRFDERARLELFARGRVDGWTTYGFEAQHAGSGQLVS